MGDESVIKKDKRDLRMRWYQARRSVLLLGILGLALGTRISLDVWFQLFDTDTLAYARQARNLLEGRGFFFTFMPLFPHFLALLYLLFNGIALFIATYVHIVIGTITCLLIYFIGRELFNPFVGLLAALIAAVSPTLALYSYLVMTETIYIFLICLGTLLILKFRPLLAGLVLGLGVLTRPHLLGFIPLLLVAVVVWDRARGRFRRIAFMAVGMILILSLWGSYAYFFVTPQAPWPVQNHVKLPKVAVSLPFFKAEQRVVVRVAMYAKNALCALAIGFDEYYNAAATWGRRKNYCNGQKPYMIAVGALKKLKLLWALSPPSWKYQAVSIKPLVRLFYGVLFALALGGLIIYRGDRRLALPLSYLVSFSLVNIPLFSTLAFRARAPVEPFIILLSALSLYKLYERLRSRVGRASRGDGIDG